MAVDIALRILATLGLVLANAFFVAAEFAAVSARVSRLQQEAKHSFLARVALRIKRRLDLYLSSCQLGVTLASLALGAVTEPAIARLLHPLLEWVGVAAQHEHAIAFTIALAISTSLHITVGEQAPKNWSIQFADRVLPATSLPLAAFTWTFYPLIAGLNWASNGLLRLSGVTLKPGLHGDTTHTEEELRTLLLESIAGGAIQKRAGAIIRSAFEFNNLKVRQIMTPRTSVDFIALGDPVKDILNLVHRSQYTRLPLCEHDIDHVIGLVHMKDLFNHLQLVPGRLHFADSRTPDDQAIAIVDGKPGSALHVIGSADLDLKKIMRKIFFVPESATLPHVLHQFQLQRIHMAVVVDEYGATQGIVTLEDVLEELVGDIGDEFDAVPAEEFVQESEQSYRVSGMFAIHALRERLDLGELPTGDVDTLGGYIVQELGHWPKAGDAVELGAFTVTVLSVQQNRVVQTRVTRKPATRA